MTTPTSSRELTPAELAVSEKRRLKKLRAAAAREKVDGKPELKELTEPMGAIFPREWISMPTAEAAQTSGDVAVKLTKVKVMTWNLLAQCLVRRELFPHSDCLKAAQREHMLYREILSLDPDICCLQEVDRTEKLFPVLENAGYAHVYAAGPRKKHGCTIAFRKSAFELVNKKVVVYDEESVRPEASDMAEIVVERVQRRTRASTRVTKNIANLVALKRVDGVDDGVIVATTHLFWHPRFTYERARQTAILFREVDRFRKELGHSGWPCIVAGDFNFAPDDATYSLLTGEALLPSQVRALEHSRVVHVSLDPSAQAETAAAVQDGAEEESGGRTDAGRSAEAAEEKEKEEEQDPDRVITNARRAVEGDGLLDDIELEKLFAREREEGRLFSAYDRGMSEVLRAVGQGQSSQELRNLTMGSRVPTLAGRHGAHEPVWTSYTEYWKTVLDYIFVLDSSQCSVSVLALTKPHTADKLSSGLPMKGICGSDHISLAAELAWFPAETSTP